LYGLVKQYYIFDNISRILSVEKSKFIKLLNPAWLIIEFRPTNLCEINIDKKYHKTLKPTIINTKLLFETIIPFWPEIFVYANALRLL
jgi:hypothetical protein